MPEFRFYIYDTVKFFDVCLNNVHTHAASGDACNFLCGGEAGFENKVECTFIIKIFSFFRSYDAFFDCFLFKFCSVHTLTVIPDFNHNVVSFMVCGKMYGSFNRFTCFSSFFRAFNTMIHCVSDHVYKRVAYLFHDRFIKLCFFTGYNKLDLLIFLSGEVTHHTGKFIENFADGNHSCFHHSKLKLCGNKPNL